MSSRSQAALWPYPRHRDFESALQKASAEWFADRGFAVHPKMPYLLAEWEDWGSNIILPEVAEYIIKERQIRSAKKGFPLHKYIHHGLSSQAMLFNLVGPLIVRQDLEPLEAAFEQENIRWYSPPANASLEYENRSVFNEDSGQPTSIDLVVQDESGKPRVFIEAKLVEREFGGCSVFAAGDCDGRNPAQDFSLCYLHYIGRRYWEILGKYGFLDGPIGNDATCILAAHYQFFREVLFALELRGAFVLLSDERNPTFICAGPSGKRGLVPFLLSFVPKNLHDRVAMVSIQQVVQAIKSSGRHAWIEEFEKKYGLIP
jgi:hypothetical protein